MSVKWKEAAKSYRQASLNISYPNNENTEFSEGLKNFLESEEGEDALNLLGATVGGIFLGKETDEGYDITYVLQGKGLRSITSSQIGFPKNMEHVITPAEAIRVLSTSHLEHVQPEQALSWIKSKLDGLASRILLGDYTGLIGAPTKLN